MEESKIEWWFYDTFRKNFCISINSDSIENIKNWKNVRINIFCLSELRETTIKELSFLLMTDEEFQTAKEAAKQEESTEIIWSQSIVEELPNEIRIKISKQLLDDLLWHGWDSFEYCNDSNKWHNNHQENTMEFLVKDFVRYGKKKKRNKEKSRLQDSINIYKELHHI